ncbi:MAG: T9SS type A sorting domain-containing protein [Bacteroidota bacterium]|nr:T9SS type A sorting domain-containing protein [Bacteroidota bacterium]
MRKIIFSLFFLLCIISFQLNNADAGDRKVLIERFTSSTCPPCSTNNPRLDLFLSNADPDRVTSISYHMNWPSPGNDPMFFANPIDNNARRTVYGVNSIPAWFFDGVITLPGGFAPQIQSAYETRRDILSPVTIIVTQTITGSNVSVRAEVYCECYLPSPNAVIHLAVIEDLIQYTGTNGETIYHDVMRKMLPSSAGTPVVLIPGQKTIIDYSYTMDPTWNAAQIRNLVFVQQSTPLEILNSALPTNNFDLISTPSLRTVLQGQIQSANFKAHIPSVALGYNSPVTFSYEVTPAASGITAEFPAGNIISSFPDSISVNVMSSASVPAGEYKIILTGTNAAGVIHKTIVNYLVGQNYIVVGTNRSNLNFKVDNTTYNSTRVFPWDVNSSHSLEATSPQTTGNFRYIFTNWSNGGTQIQNINVGTTENIYTANYKVQYRLLGQTSPAGLPVTISGAGVYYDSASVNDIGLSAMQVQHNGKTYYFQRWNGSGLGSYTGPNPVAQVTNNSVIVQTAVFDTTGVGISNYNSTIPEKFNLYQNYPNPFNPTTNIKFDIAKSSFTSITIYDVVGKEIAALVKQDLAPGRYQYTLDASNFPSGIYYYQIKTNDYSEIRKMILLK